MKKFYAALAGITGSSMALAAPVDLTSLTAAVDLSTVTAAVLAVGVLVLSPQIAKFAVQTVRRFFPK